MTTPLFAETTDLSGTMLNASPHQESSDISERIGHLEVEVSELKDTVARFAELVLGEVKDLRHSQVETPPMPPALMSELEASGSAPHGASATENGREGAAPLRRPWLLTELLADVASTFRMYLDPRYRVRRSTQIMVPFIIGVFALNCFFFRALFAIPILSSVLEKIVDAVLAILIYKVLIREVNRYRQVLAQLVAWQEYRTRTTAVIGGDQPTTRLETE